MKAKPIGNEFTYPHKYNIGDFVAVKDFIGNDLTEVQIVSRIGLAPGEISPRYEAYHDGSRVTNRINEYQITRLLNGPTNSDPYENYKDNEKKEVVDNVNHPPHYKKHPSGVECIEITRHMNFNLGNALKYIWRCDLKKDAIEDLEKSIWYLNDEIVKRKKEKNDVRN